MSARTTLGIRDGPGRKNKAQEEGQARPVVVVVVRSGMEGRHCKPVGRRRRHRPSPTARGHPFDGVGGFWDGGCGCQGRGGGDPGCRLGEEVEHRVQVRVGRDPVAMATGITDPTDGRGRINHVGIDAPRRGQDQAQPQHRLPACKQCSSKPLNRDNNSPLAVPQGFRCLRQVPCDPPMEPGSLGAPAGRSCRRLVHRSQWGRRDTELGHTTVTLR